MKDRESEAPITEADLARWETATSNASRGPWEWWTSCSFRRLSGADGKDGGVLRAVVYQDGQPEIECTEEDMDFIEEARDAMPRLLAEVRQLRATLRICDETGRDFLAMLDSKYLGQIERSDARPLREMSQMIRRLNGGPVRESAIARPCQFVARIPLFVDGEVSAEEAESLRVHIGTGCLFCRRALETHLEFAALAYQSAQRRGIDE